MSLIAVHGINTNGQGNVDTLCTAVASHTGMDLVNFDYPKINLFQAAWALSFFQYDNTRKALARKLFNATKDGDHIIAHSFGAAVVYACMSDFKRRFGHVWLIAPALNHDDVMTGFNEALFDSLTVVHNPYDRALIFGKKLPWVDLSDAGLFGYTPAFESNVSNLAMPERFLRGDDSDWLNHSYAFKGNNLDTLTRIILDQVRS